MTETLGTRLRQERARLSLTQDQFAALGGVARLAQSKYENDQHSPSADYLQRLLLAKVDVLYVLSGQIGRDASALNWDDGHEAFSFVMKNFLGKPGKTYTSDQLFEIFRSLWQTMMDGAAASPTQTTEHPAKQPVVQ